MYKNKQISATKKFDEATEFRGPFENNGNSFIIVKFLKKEPDKNRMVEIEFCNKNMFGFNTRKICQYSQVKNIEKTGKFIKDVYMPSSQGIGCIGNVPSTIDVYDKHGKIKKIEHKLHKRWATMMADVKEYYDKYGNLDIIYRDWLCYEFFLRDVMKMPNYDKYMKTDNYAVVKPKFMKGYFPDTIFIIDKRLIGVGPDHRSNSKYHGVDQRGIVERDTYQCTVLGMYFGTFTNEEAAANMYNLIIQKMFDGDVLPSYLFNNVKHMDIEEITKYRVEPLPDVNGNKLLYKPYEYKSVEEREAKENIHRKDMDSNKIWENGGDPVRIIKDHHSTTFDGKGHIVDVEFVIPNMFGFNTIRRNVDMSNVRNGTVKDVYKPSVFGVACIGNANTLYIDIYGHTRTLIEYILWSGMISRCHNQYDGAYAYYGACGVTVDPRWLCFENFLIDLPYIEGYDLWRNNPSAYHLDKDQLQFNLPKHLRVYSRETCRFIPRLDNIIFGRFEAKENYYDYMGVYQQKSGNWSVSVGHKHYGTYTCIEAAANMYNLVAARRGYNPEYLNPVQVPMTIDQVHEFKVLPKPTKDGYALYKLIDNKNIKEDSPYIENYNSCYDVDKNLEEFLKTRCK